MRTGRWAETKPWLGSFNDVETKEVGEYVGGLRHGEWRQEHTWRFFFSTDAGPPYIEVKTTSTRTFVAGRLHGRRVDVNASGQVIADGEYVEGAKHGVWTYRNGWERVDEGLVQRFDHGDFAARTVQTWKYGTLVSTRHYDE